jgi:para-nitrobenzyl esterase
MEEIIFSCPCGEVKGQKSEDAFFFCGIGYAHTKRFEKPELIRKWDGIFDATKTEIDCYQKNSFYKENKEGFYAKEFRSNREFFYDETPMTLNIVTPSNEGKRPVLLFFHGGAFETGTVGELPYGTCRGYANRDVVFVSAGYRLNVFGLYGGENYILMDQIAAVDWVRENIASFGGNPDNITLIGQSAGAMCIMNLLCSGKLTGKIKQAVMMSGAGVVPKIAAQATKEKMKVFWNKVDEFLNADAKTADAKDLWDAWQMARKEDKLLSGFCHSQPCIDGEVLTMTQKAAVASGTITDIPLMVGVTSQDMLPILLYPMTLKLGVSLAKIKHMPVYGYLFDRTLPGNSYKAFHASDLWYMFGNLEQSWRPFEKTDYELCDEMMDEVAAFCKTGKPKSKTWLPISKNQKGFRHFDGVDRGLVFPKFCNAKMRESTFKTPGPI